MDAVTFTPTDPLDEGAALVVRGPDGEDLELLIVAHRALGGTSTKAMVSISRQFEGPPAPIARAGLDVASGEVTRLDDPEGVLPADRAQAWVRGLLAGDDGARLIERFHRSRRQRDRRTWQAFDWGSRGRERAVPYLELFPHDWTWRVKETPPLWIHEGYCVRPGCDCQDVTLVLADDDGRVAGRAVVRLHGAESATVKTSDHAVAGVARALAGRVEVVLAWHDRFREVRELVRFRKTWSADVAAPEKAVARLVRDEGPLARPYVYNLGDRIVPALRAFIDDDSRPTADRIRAVQLVTATDTDATIGVVAAALASPWLSATSRAHVIVDLVDDAVDLGEALAEALLAGLSPDSPEAVVAVLARFPKLAPAVAAAADAWLEREPVRWLPLVPNSPDAVPRIRQLLERAMAAEPIDLALANAAVDKLIELEVDVDGDILDRLDEPWTPAAFALPSAAKAKPRAAPTPAPPPLVGGNRPCWCGSGKKRKLCHRAEEPPP